VAANDKPVAAISPEAMAWLVGYGWPGNVRELEHAIERAVALTTNSVLRPDDLPPKLGRAAGREGAVAGPPLSLREVVTRHVRRGDARHSLPTRARGASVGGHLDRTPVASAWRRAGRRIAPLLGARVDTEGWESHNAD